MLYDDGDEFWYHFRDAEAASGRGQPPARLRWSDDADWGKRAPPTARGEPAGSAGGSGGKAPAHAEKGRALDMARDVLSLVRELMGELFAAHWRWRPQHLEVDLHELGRMLRAGASARSWQDTSRNVQEREVSLRAHSGVVFLLEALLPCSYLRQRCLASGSSLCEGSEAGTAVADAMSKAWQVCWEICRERLWWVCLSLCTAAPLPHPPSPSSPSHSHARYNDAWRKCSDPKQAYQMMCLCVSCRM